MDEATPHMHINLVPVVNDKVCYADLFTEKPQKSRGGDGKQLTALHDDFYKHNQDNGYDLERGELQSVTGKKEHLSVLDFKKQERTKEVGELEAKKEQTAESVLELQNTAHQLQGDIKLLEDEKKRLEGLKNDLQGQIKTAQDELGKLDGKILTKHGIDKISENKKVSRGIFGKDDMATLPDADFNSLVRTALASPRVETSEENKRLKAENEAIKKEAAKVQPLALELERTRKAVNSKDGKISELSESLDKQERRAEYWITKANTSETNYSRVLRELNDLKGRGKNRGLDRD